MTLNNPTLIKSFTPNFSIVLISFRFSLSAQFPSNSFFSGFYKIRLKANLFYQCFMSAFLHNFTMIQYQDFFCISDCFQAMCDHNYGFVPGKLFNGLLQPVLIFRIHIGGYFIKNDDLCVFDQCPRNGYPLFSPPDKEAPPSPILV